MKSEKECSEYLLEKFWDNYKYINLRRRRAFYYLYYTLIVFGLLAVTPFENLQIEIFKLKIQVFVAVTLGPAIILLLYNSYLYLCAHTTISLANYLALLIKNDSKKYDEIGYPFSILHNTLKIRDVTEILNIFLFPIIKSNKWDASIKKGFSKLSKWFINPVLLITLVLPFGAYIFMLVWMTKLDQNLISDFAVKVIQVFYIILGISFIITPIFFKQRVDPYRKIFYENYKTENSKNE